jgi:glutamine amidotransferase
MKEIVVVDIGISNILSIKNALEYCGATVIVTNKKKIIENSRKIILPGVGAFDQAISNINKLNIKQALVRHCKDQNKYYLGICLGMQILFEKGYENRLSNGLSIIKGNIKKMSNKEKNFKVPHIGWNKVYFKNLLTEPLFKNIKNFSYFYFVHSYYACNIDNKNNLALTNYGNLSFPSIVSKNNVYGIQFHAEKSSESGLTLLKNFINL